MMQWMDVAGTKATFELKENIGGSSKKISVTEDQWLKFRNELNQLKVWNWRRRYDDPKIYGGTVWEVRIKYHHQTIIPSGSNGFPPQPQFKSLLRAVSGLAKGNTFEI